MRRSTPKKKSSGPRHYPRPVRFLLEEKLRRALALLEPLASTDALCVCGGSGMDAEWLAHLGIHPTILDVSPDALARARIRAAAAWVRR